MTKALSQRQGALRYYRNLKTLGVKSPTRAAAKAHFVSVSAIKKWKRLELANMLAPRQKREDEGRFPHWHQLKNLMLGLPYQHDDERAVSLFDITGVR